MKILCVHQGYELYGSDRSFALSVGILRKMYPSAVIDIMIPKSGEIESILYPVCNRLIINEGLAILRKKELKNNPFKFAYKVLKGIVNAIDNAKKYDVIYVNTIVVLDYIIASRFVKTTSILHVREIPTGIQKKIFSSIVRFSKMKIIFNSQNTEKSFDLSEKQSHVTLLNGVNGFRNEDINISSTIHILVLGRLTSWKGQMFFLQTINDLLKLNNYDIQVRIVGDVFEDQIEYKNSLVDFVQSNNLENIVTFKSFVNNPEEEYRWSDIVVVPSVKPEPFGGVAIEAMSMSKCVIVANHGGLSEIVTNKKDGVLFEPNNSKSLLGELKNLINNPKKIVEYGINGNQTFFKKFSNEVYEKKFKRIITKYLDK